MMKKTLIIIIAAALLLPGFTGCKKTPPRQIIQKAKVTAPAAPQVEETLKPVKEKEEVVYVYDSKGMRSPFRSLIKVTKKKDKKGTTVATSPLESFDASDFKLLAIAGKAGKYTGLILAPDNKSYIVKEGTVLGLHEGKIKQIGLIDLVVEEYIMDYTGELKPNQIVLELRKGEVTE